MVGGDRGTAVVRRAGSVPAKPASNRHTPAGARGRRALQPPAQPGSATSPRSTVARARNARNRARLWLKKPRKMRWEYRSPKEKLFVSDGELCGFTCRRNDSSERRDFRKLDDLRSPIAFLLGKTKLENELQGLSKATDQAPMNSGDILLRGVPRHGRPGQARCNWRSRPPIRSSRIVLMEPDGGTTEFRFAGWKENVELSDSRFRFTPPAGVETSKEHWLPRRASPLPEAGRKFEVTCVPHRPSCGKRFGNRMLHLRLRHQESIRRQMAEFLVKVADEQGHMRQQVEHGYSEAEVHDRFTQQGYLVYWVKPRTMLSGGGGKFGQARQAAAIDISDFQPAVSDADQGRAADPDGAGSPDQAAAGQTLLSPRERARAGKRRRVAVRCFCRPAGVSQDVHHHADGGRKKRQHGRSSEPLHHLPAHGADFPQKAPGVAGVPGAAGFGGHGAC